MYHGKWTEGDLVAAAGRIHGPCLAARGVVRFVACRPWPGLFLLGATRYSWMAVRPGCHLVFLAATCYWWLHRAARRRPLLSCWWPVLLSARCTRPALPSLDVRWLSASSAFAELVDELLLAVAAGCFHPAALVGLSRGPLPLAGRRFALRRVPLVVPAVDGAVAVPVAPLAVPAGVGCVIVR